MNGESMIRKICYSLREHYRGYINSYECNMSKYMCPIRFCDPCKAGLNTATLPCELCSFHGGAYKPTDTGKWVHSLCSIWIPEIFHVNVGGTLTLTTRALDKKRFRLKCALCNTKGACIQCSHGRCVTSAHPWCVLNTPKGFTRRVIKDEERNMLWEVFCKTHASAVTEPLKPKPKSKMVHTLPIESLGISDEPSEEAKADRRRSSEYRPAKLDFPFSMMHSVKRNPLFINDGGAHSKSNPPMYKDHFESEDDDESDWDDDDSTKPKRSKPKRDKAATASLAKANTGSKEEASRFSSCKYSLLNMNEWPGQAEGEAMDLDHFWNIVGMSYPEDQPPEWMTSMLDPFVHLADDDGAMDTLLCMPCLGPPKKGDTRETLATDLENKLCTLGTEKERYAMFDFSKRKYTLSAALSRSYDITRSTNATRAALARMPVGEYMDRIIEEGAVLAASQRPAFGAFETAHRDSGTDLYTSSLPHSGDNSVVGGSDTETVTDTRSEFADSEKNGTFIGRGYLGGIENSSASGPPGDPQANSSVSVPVITRSVMVNGRSQKIFSVDAEPIIDEGSFFLRHKGALEPVEKLEGVDDEGNTKIRVVLDGPDRLACEFTVKVSKGDSGSGDASGGGKPHTVLLTDTGNDSSTVNQSTTLLETLRKYIMQPGGVIGGDASTDLESVEISLASLKNLDDRHTVFLNDLQIIANEENDILTRLIRTEQIAYTDTVKAVADKANLVSSLNLADVSSDAEKKRKQWTALETHYMQQRVWSKIAAASLRGMRDQRPDFNKSEEEAIPASWKIKVDGRPTAKPDEEEEQEDAVCMVCFDGASAEGNRILFCDGCNAAIHQYCYGIPEIPEGDFFCDRCTAIQQIASDEAFFEPEDAKDAVKCCLCPQHHGAIKATTDGRWVHLCCSMWATGAVITDMQEMGPVNLSKVPVQVPEIPEIVDVSGRGRVRRTTNAEDEPAAIAEAFAELSLIPSDITTACSICNSKGGYVVKCCAAEDGIDGGCGTVFHPLCAWFAGLHVKLTSLDDSFQATNHGAVYPSGFEFAFYCPTHCPPESQGEVRTQQMTLRQKYRINELDLEVIPGKGKSRKKKKNKPRPSTAGGTAGKTTSSSSRVAAGGQNKAGDMKKDAYDDSVCAYSMECLDDSFFSDEGGLLKIDDISTLRGAENTPAICKPCNGIQECKATDGAVVKSEKYLGDQIGNQIGSIEALAGKDTEAVESELNQTGGAHQAQAPGDPIQASALNNVSTPTPKQPSHVADNAITPKPAASDTAQLDAAQQLALLASVATGTAGSADPKTEDVKSDLASGRINETGPAIKSEPTAADQTPLPSAAPPAPPTPAQIKTFQQRVLTCCKCKIHVLKSCYDACHEKGIGAIAPDGTWTCSTCAWNLEDVTCELCPRKGGGFLPTLDGKWAHLYCAKNAPGNVRVKEGVIEIRNIPKEFKKEKCFVCNRKKGVCIRCTHPGCEKSFHPLCGARSGKVYSFNRGGFYGQYCSDHIPEYVVRTPKGFWVDVDEMMRFRFSLDRARIILDQLSRREKFKRMLCKAELECFSKRFHRILDKAKGRKTLGENGEAVSDDESVQSEDYDDVMTEEKEIIAKAKEDAKVRKEKQMEKDLEKGPDVNVQTRSGETVFISGNWTKKDGTVSVPTNVIVGTAGLEILQTDIRRAGELDAFMTEQLSHVDHALDLSRPSTQLFKNKKEALAFEDSLRSQLRKHLLMTSNEFQSDIPKGDFLYLCKEISKAPKDTRWTRRFHDSLMNPPAEDDSDADQSDEAGQRTRSSIRQTPADSESALMEKLEETTHIGRRSPRARDQEKEKDAFGQAEVASKKDNKRVLDHGDDDKADDIGKSRKKNQNTVVPALEPGVTNTMKRGRDRSSMTGDDDHVVTQDQKKSKLEARDRSKVAEDAAAASQETRAGEKQSTPTMARWEMEENMLSDKLFFAINDGLQGVKGGFAAIVQPLDFLQTARQESDLPKENNDWHVYDAETLPELECRLQFILKEIQLVEAPLADSKNKPASKGSKPKPTRSSNRRKNSSPHNGSLEKDSNEANLLANDFYEIPYEVIPNYDEHVRRPISIEIMEARLQSHGYRSMSAFCKDFYDMLNNGKYVTEGAKQTSLDADALAKALEDLKKASLETMTNSSLDRVLCRGRRRAGSDREQRCSCCDKTVSTY